jgi:ribonuclease BN (tRNA processing enzyme)
MRLRGRADDGIHFDVWGCRGSRNFIPVRSKIGNLTSCYSLRVGDDLYVLDAGRGMASLASAVRAQPRFRSLARVHVLVTHGHMDHWEGLKDADWFWLRGNGLQVTIWATEQGLAAIRAGHEHPAYVPLEMLAEGTLSGLAYNTLKPNEARSLQRVEMKTYALNHYSGQGFSRRQLDTVGFRLEVSGGPTICYLSDHEPNMETVQTEVGMLSGAQLAVFDSHFPDIKRQAHGHGSQEHTANMARSHPEVLVLAGHHGPMFSDDEIRATHKRHGRGLSNFQLAVEGTTYAWDASKTTFKPSRNGR